MNSPRWADGLDAIDFPKILERLSRETETQMGRERTQHLEPSLGRQHLLAEQAALREARMLLVSGDASLSGAITAGTLARIAAKGGVHGGEALWGIVNTLRVGLRLTRQITDGRFPTLNARCKGVYVPESLLDALAGALREDGELKDQASRELASIRRQIREESRALDVVFERILSMPSWAPYLQDRVVTLRFGRRVVPVKIEFRNKVRGLVHDESASGQTVFVEPLQALEHQNHLTVLERNEAEEIERILTMLSAAVGAEADVLERLQEVLGWLDEMFAKVRLGGAMRATLPDLGGDRLRLIEARHPLLTTPVPISVELSPDQSVLVVTGPNTGGKTVALKTVGLMVAMALSGMMIPCQDATTIPFYERLWLDIGDDQSIEQNLSTFSSHLSRLIPMMREARPSDLCLIDEIGSGTDPEEGSVLAEAMIERLYQAGAHVMVTTHLGRLKLLAYRIEGIENAQVEFDRQSLRPTYRLLTGYPGSSHALYVAERLGMPVPLLERARERMDPEAEAMKRALEDLEQINARLRDETADLLLREQHLQDRDRQLSERETRLERERQAMRERGLNTWKRQLDELTRKFDQVIREVRSQDAQERQAAMEKLRQAFRAAQDLPSDLQSDGPALGDNERLQVGDWVMAEGFRDAGRLVELQGRTATVEVGALRLKLPLSDMRKASQSADSQASRRKSSQRTLSAPVRSTVGTELDLRGLTVDDAVYTCDRYLDEAVLGNAPWVRIIHGKGTGALRKAIQQQLAGDPRVVQYRLGESGEGGDGVTVAYLEEPNQ